MDKLLRTIFIICYLPMLLCIFFIGSRMDYCENNKLQTTMPNLALTIVAAVVLVVAIMISKYLNKIELTKKVNIAMHVILIGFFVFLYFLNIAISKEIIFNIPWDISVTTEGAYAVAYERPFGYQYYYSMYTNNLAIIYVLGIIYRFAMNLPNYGYPTDFIWCQVNCIIFSVAGYLTCVTVKKLTNKLTPVLVAFGSYFILAGISPWKIAPYTDTYAMLFPILAIFLYVCYEQAENKVAKCIFLAMAYLSAGVGAFIKTSVYVLVIALALAELARLINQLINKEFVIGNIKYLLVSLIMTLLVVMGINKAKMAIIDYIQLDFNPVIEVGWQHYLMMGLNEETTGGYDSDAISMYNEFQFDKADRNAEELRISKERYDMRGFFGTLYFYLRKMVMTFNDGTFGWRAEIWVKSYYEDVIMSDTPFGDKMRGTFWPHGSDNYNTLCQFVWLFELLLLPGVWLANKRANGKYRVFIIMLLGLFFYQMIFEARARYLFVFLPMLISYLCYGFDSYCHLNLRRREGSENGKVD